MKFPVTMKQLIGGRWQARSVTTVLGEVSVVGDSREDAAKRMGDELRYRLEYCP